MKRQELLKQIGSIEQIGGIKDYTINDGKGKGVRVIEVNTGSVRFCVLPDRCMDIAQAYYKNNAVSWISKTGITSPAFYEKDGLSWLRSFYGGLITTCGLKNIGGPVGAHGLHGRIANIPAAKVSVYADWEGDDYVMRVSGEMRESVVFGENIVLKRTITAKLFDDEFIVEDALVNEGFSDEDIALCYHCNFGYPLVREGAKIINVPEEHSKIGAPVHGIEEECIDVKHTGEIATAGIENGEIGAYITYKRDTMPNFLVWKMLGESDYVVGLEPRTTSLGGEDIMKKNKFVSLKPFEEYKSHLKFSFKKL
ncbi:MAG: DUF4432 family protein [Ruminococcaceae bacterium]|nr:DUF4432 family protein [Oscillospiraceae bacterium]